MLCVCRPELSFQTWSMCSKELTHPPASGNRHFTQVWTCLVTVIALGLDQWSKLSTWLVLLLKHFAKRSSDFVGVAKLEPCVAIPPICGRDCLRIKTTWRKIALEEEREILEYVVWTLGFSVQWSSEFIFSLRPIWFSVTKRFWWIFLYCITSIFVFTFHTDVHTSQIFTEGLMHLKRITEWGIIVITGYNILILWLC